MGGSKSDGSFKPSLLIVDMQEDFCATDGSLAVKGGQDIAPVINDLLSLPFALKIATKDWHPQNHASFDTSHPPPNNKAFESAARIVNPNDQTQSYDIPIWPKHCVQGTKGAEIIPKIDIAKVNEVVEKGKDGKTEMFSAFTDVFGSRSSEAASLDLAQRLRAAGITHVFTAELAGDYCVKCTALDAKEEGFEVYVVDEATRSVDAGEKGWGAATRQLEQAGIKIIHIDGPEMAVVRKAI